MASLNKFDQIARLLLLVFPFVYRLAQATAFDLSNAIFNKILIDNWNNFTPVLTLNQSGGS